MKTFEGITIEQLISGFDRSVEALDEVRAMQLGESMRLQIAKAHVDDRELLRLTRRFGSEHPRTKTLAAKIEINRDHIQGLAMEYAGASRKRPEAGKGWAVDGFVRTAEGEPVAGITVATYDSQGNWNKDFGHACTDKKGYFSLVVEKLSAKLPRPVFLRVSNGKKLLASNIPQVAPAPGIADRVEIIIGEDGDKGDCPPPTDKNENPPNAPTPPKDKTETGVINPETTGKEPVKAKENQKSKPTAKARVSKK